MGSVNLPRLWRRKRADGREFGSYHVVIKKRRVNLRTSDAEKARRRRLEAWRGKKDFMDDVEAAAAVAVEAFDSAPADLFEPRAQSAPTLETPASPAPVVPPPPPVTPMPVPPPVPLIGLLPDGYAPPGAAGWQDDASAAAGAASAPEMPLPTSPPEVSDEELAGLGVEGQLWFASMYARQKIWKGFQAPKFPEEAKAELAAPWKKLIAYANVGAILPAWVTGLVIPVVTIIASTAAMAGACAELAKEQKRAAGVVDEPPAADERAAA
jgi:hypothetical protein